VLIFELLVEATVVVLLFVKSPINTVPLKLATIPAKDYIGNEEYHPMTSSSKLAIYNSMSRALRALFACFVLKGLTEILLYSDEVIIATGLQFAIRGIGYIFLFVAQSLSNRMMYLMSKKSIDWKKYKLVFKKSDSQIENFVDHLKLLIIISLVVLSILVVLDFSYVVMFANNVGHDFATGQCLSGMVDFSEAGCKALIIIGLISAIFRFLTTIFTIFLYSRSLVVVDNEIDFDPIPPECCDTNSESPRADSLKHSDSKTAEIITSNCPEPDRNYQKIEDETHEDISCTDDNAKETIRDAAMMADELRSAQNQPVHMELYRKNMDATVKDLNQRLKKSE